MWWNVWVLFCFVSISTGCHTDCVCFCIQLFVGNGLDARRTRVVRFTRPSTSCSHTKQRRIQQESISKCRPTIIVNRLELSLDWLHSRLNIGYNRSLAYCGVSRKDAPMLSLVSIRACHVNGTLIPNAHPRMDMRDSRMFISSDAAAYKEKHSLKS